MRTIWILLAISSICYAYDWSTNPGDGSPQNPYQISEPNQLNSIGCDPNLLDKCFILTNNIDMSGIPGTQYNTIGYFNDHFDRLPFTGLFDGRGYTISNFTYEYTPESRSYGAGLFAYVDGDSTAQIKNLTLSEPNVICNEYVEYVACLVGSFAHISNPQGIISNCHIQNGSVRGGRYVALLTGFNGGTLSRCSSSGGRCVETIGIAGSIVGMNGHIIERCHANGIIDGKFAVGGFAGVNKGTIKNCYFEGFVSGQTNTGGFVGEQLNSLYNCFSSAQVSGGYNTGAFAGSAGLGFSNCFWNSSLCLLQGIGSYPPSYTGLAGKTTEELQFKHTFSGWDFVGEDVNGNNNIWRMCIDGVDYPRLSWEFAQNGDFACPDGVGMDDLEALAFAWLTADSESEFNYACDGSGDGRIDQQDMAILSTHWKE